VKSHTAIFQYLLLAVIAALLLVFCYHTVPEGNQRYIDVLLGAIIGAFTTAAVKDAAIDTSSGKQISDEKTDAP